MCTAPHRVSLQAVPELPEGEVSAMFDAMDLNRTGTVDVKEFFAALLHTIDHEQQVTIARKSFYQLDV